MNFKRLTSLGWSYSLLKDIQNKLEPLWDQFSSLLEDIAMHNQDIFKEDFKQTVFIAKSLSYLDSTITRFPNFWRQFFMLVRDKTFVEDVIAKLAWDDWSKLLFACS